ncbi:Os03g0758700 [Oryza sativa Japonica Group]|uniref:Os03g0758700 protein n=1 Tax=Oryza sativa subsp. japonica TaxID=39947 RepID=Q10CJ9_ORYSJ|nr:transducin family protein, putative, expressed [Oryza sativa Japonica Group]KAB8093666.1 hypothetical protein EE612_020567 [Oryza sativa]KAF2941429.1 hypothetical protein DAI22_03g345800 [Oryza sativa Japonica Group]BAS86486.1 Os03g0758700 [Oryza sativa Japonica Group]
MDSCNNYLFSEFFLFFASNLFSEFHNRNDNLYLLICVYCCVVFLSGQVVTATLDKKLMFWDSQTRNVNPNSIKNLDSDVASLSVCEMYILAAIEREVYIYDMRNLIGPVKVKDSPVEYHLRSLHSSPEWKGYAAGSVDGVVAVKYFDRGTDGDMGYVFRCHPKSRDGRSSMVPINSIGIHPLYVLYFFFVHLPAVLFLKVIFFFETNLKVMWTHWFLIGSDKTFVTGDNEGYVIAWDAQSKKKLHEFPIYSGSVASIAFNHNGQIFAVASNSNYQESDKMVEEHQIFFEMKQHF